MRATQELNQLKAAMDRGEDIAQIMTDTRKHAGRES